MMNPAFTMSAIVIRPLEKTIALGGVPIDNMLAQLAASFMGIPNKK